MELKAVWSGADSVFAVGRWGQILRYDKETQTVIGMKSNVQETLNGIWGAADNDMFAVGNDGAIINYDGNSRNEWTRFPEATDWILHAVWGTVRQMNGGTSPTDVFAVGEAMTILRYRDPAWSRMQAPPSSTVLQAVWGSSSDDVFAAGDAGEIFHFDGVQWSKMRSPTGAPITSNWETPGGEYIVIADSAGRIFRRRTNLP